MPTMTAPEADSPAAAAPDNTTWDQIIPEEDDIVDPMVPPEALPSTATNVVGADDLNAVKLEVLNAVRTLLAPLFQDALKHAETTYNGCITAIQQEAQRLQRTITATDAAMMETLAQGIREGIAHHVQQQVTPFRAEVETRSPKGFPMRFTVEALTLEELMTTTGQLAGSLTAGGWTPPA